MDNVGNKDCRYFLNIAVEDEPAKMHVGQAVELPPDHSIKRCEIRAMELSNIKLSLDLVTASNLEANFLRMIDKDMPMLYDEHVIQNAIRRYEQYWLPLQAKLQDCNVVPPLDVHWVWHTHMLSPHHYIRDCTALVGTLIDHKLLGPAEIQECYQCSVKAWEAYCSLEPYDFIVSTKLNTDNSYIPKSSYDISSAIQRQRNFNYQISLPHYTSQKFLAEAVQRYQKFLFLNILYPDEFLTPCYDFDVVWHCHQVHPTIYAQDMQRLMGKILKHDDSVNDREEGSKLLRGEAMTIKLWNQHFPDDSFSRRGAMYRGHLAPACMGFDRQDLPASISGNVHISSVSLMEIPIHREKLKLKLSYGSRKVKTFTNMTKQDLIFTWKPAENSGTMLSSVDFPFDRKHPKDLVMELELYNSNFLQKGDLVKLAGRIPLEDLLPKSNCKSVQSTAILYSQQKLQHPIETVSAAKVQLITTLSAMRKFQLTVNEFVKRDLTKDYRLHDFCNSAALNKSGLNNSNTAWFASHILLDRHFEFIYEVQVIHSASALLSAVFVFDKDQKMLAMAHLIGTGSLPSKEQLDKNLQQLPHLSSADERSMVIINADGDFAIVKGKWTGFKKRVAPDSQKRIKGKHGKPGKLTVESFNLFNKSVHKFVLPNGNSTKFSIGDAEANLSNIDIECHTMYVAEHIACIFSTAILFVLCNPDKPRTRHEATSVGLQCQNWPLVMAAGYGKDNPNNKFLAGNSSEASNNEYLMFACSGGDMGTICGACGSGGCGACGGCGGCGSGGGGCGGCGGGGCGGGGCGGCGGG